MDKEQVKRLASINPNWFAEYEKHQWVLSLVYKGFSFIEANKAVEEKMDKLPKERE